jgi:hypothetical protein
MRAMGHDMRWQDERTAPLYLSIGRDPVLPVTAVQEDLRTVSELERP